MIDDAGLIAGIEKKTMVLVRRHRELRDKVEKYENEIQELKKTNEEQTNTINQLKKKIEVAKIISTIESKEGKAEAKARISELVREIDKCIGMLNR